MTHQRLREKAKDLREAWLAIADVSGSALLAGEKKAQTTKQRRLVYAKACEALIIVGNVYSDITGKHPTQVDAALNAEGEKGE